MIVSKLFICSKRTNLLDDHKNCLEAYSHKPGLNDYCPSSSQPKRLDSYDVPLSSSEPICNKIQKHIQEIYKFQKIDFECVLINWNCIGTSAKNSSRPCDDDSDRILTATALPFSKQPQYTGPKPPCPINCLKLLVNFSSSLYINRRFSVFCM